MEILRTPNLILREFTVSDARPYYEYMQDEEIAKHLWYYNYADENDTREGLRGWIANYPEKRFPYNLAIIEAKSDELIGHVGIGEFDVSETELSHEIEYDIRKEYRGNRYAAEALRAFMPWCLDVLHLEKAYASVHVENMASCKTLINAGFELIEEGKNRRGNLRKLFIYRK